MGEPRYDYAIFQGADEYVTNALMTEAEAAAQEARGFRCVRVRDEPGETLPRFRGRTYVRSERRDSRRWDR